MEKIWHNQPAAMFPQFQSLTRLVLLRCHKLKHIFSASMVQSFEQLQCLEINKCECLQVIISKEGADQVTPSFVFPHLTTLFLINLPELRRLYLGIRTVDFEWLALKELKVYSCDQVSAFTSESFSFCRSNGNYPLDILAHSPSSCSERYENIYIFFNNIKSEQF